MQFLVGLRANLQKFFNIILEILNMSGVPPKMPFFLSHLRKDQIEYQNSCINRYKTVKMKCTFLVSGFICFIAVLWLENICFDKLNVLNHNNYHSQNMSPTTCC